jgi:hypothetical protein
MNFSLFYKDQVFHQKNERVIEIGSTHHLIKTAGIQFPLPMSDPIPTIWDVVQDRLHQYVDHVST